MKKKELKKRIKWLETRISLMEHEPKKCSYCVNYEAKRVEFRRWNPLPSVMDMLKAQQQEENTAGEP